MIKYGKSEASQGFRDKEVICRVEETGSIPDPEYPTCLKTVTHLAPQLLTNCALRSLERSIGHLCPEPVLHSKKEPHDETHTSQQERNTLYSNWKKKACCATNEDQTNKIAIKLCLKEKQSSGQRQDVLRYP